MSTLFVITQNCTESIPVNNYHRVFIESVSVNGEKWFDIKVEEIPCYGCEDDYQLLGSYHSDVQAQRVLEELTVFRASKRSCYKMPASHQYL